MQYENTAPYGANAKKVTQLFIAGFVATTAMVILSHILPALGIATPDFAELDGTILNSQARPLPYSGRWWMGFIWHAIAGVFILSFLFDYLAHRMVLPNRKRVKGLLYGAGLWLLCSVVVAPLAGVGLFFEYMAEPVGLSLTALLCWATYGLVLDEMTRVRVVHELQSVDSSPEKKAA